MIKLLQSPQSFSPLTLQLAASESGWGKEGLRRDGGRRKKQHVFCIKLLVIHLSVSSLMANIQILDDTRDSLSG